MPSSECIARGDHLQFFLQKGDVKLPEKRNTILTEYTENIIFFFVCSFVYIWEKWSSILRLENKIIFSRKEISFPDNPRSIIFPYKFFKNINFSEHFQKIFRPKYNVIFLGKRNIFPDNTRKVIFQCNFFRKTIFWEHLQKSVRRKNKIIFSGKRNIVVQE